jgi:ketosteroid isomerase-like protein
MSEQENVKLAGQAYDAFKSGNIASLLNLFSEDINWDLPAVENVPFFGSRAGRGAVAEFFTQLAEHQESIEFEPRQFLPAGDTVVVLGHYTWRTIQTGRQWRSDWAHVFTIRDGKITGFKEYTDTAVMSASYQKALNA